LNAYADSPPKVIHGIYGSRAGFTPSAGSAACFHAPWVQRLNGNCFTDNLQLGCLSRRQSRARCPRLVVTMVRSAGPPCTIKL